MKKEHEAIRERVGDREVITAVSGGKDSAAMALYLMFEVGLEIRSVFIDTGWEHPKTYDYVRGELTDKLGPIEEIQPPLMMEDLIRKKAIFPSRRRRFCTEELKVRPMAAFLRDLDDPLHTVGIRAEESHSRAKMSAWEWSDMFDCWTWRPVIRWTFDDVVAIHHRHDLKPNPLYLDGCHRVGCWPCIFARKADIRWLADTDPARVQQLRDLEEEIALVAESRCRVNRRPTWFQAPIGRKGEGWPIDRVIDWSRKARGMRELELFTASAADAGCMRWGLCEIDSSNE